MTAASWPCCESSALPILLTLSARGLGGEVSLETRRRAHTLLAIAGVCIASAWNPIVIEPNRACSTYQTTSCHTRMLSQLGPGSRQQSEYMCIRRLDGHLDMLSVSCMCLPPSHRALERVDGVQLTARAPRTAELVLRLRLLAVAMQRSLLTARASGLLSTDAPSLTAAAGHRNGGGCGSHHGGLDVSWSGDWLILRVVLMD